MINDKEKENKVKKYADENFYTILANTHGCLEYVKYNSSDIRLTSFLKWPKGADSITISTSNKTTKLQLSEIKI